MDINTILTIYAAPSDAKELIRVLTIEVRDLRERNSMLCDSTAKMARDLGQAQSRIREMEHAPTSAKPEPDCNPLDVLLRHAATLGAPVRVTLAAPWLNTHNGTLEGVPIWCPDDYGLDIPWRVAGWHCGTGDDNDADECIIEVELL